MDNPITVLIAEDDLQLGFLIKENLEDEGYEVINCPDGETAWEFFQKKQPDICLLDVNMPVRDGYSLAKKIRQKNDVVPIIFLTAKSMEEDKLKGFETGADDYITKPFNLEELLLRVQKLINKNKKLQEKETVEERYNFGNNIIDFKAQSATNFRGEVIALSKKEAMLLKLLIENKNDVVPREKILQAVWGYNVYPTTRTVDNFILNFRKYFELDSRNPRYFHSIRGVGYKFMV